jgi:hypothetical protein
MESFTDGKGICAKIADTIGEVMKSLFPGEAFADEGGDVYSGGIQCGDTSLLGKISTKNKMLFKSRV